MPGPAESAKKNKEHYDAKYGKVAVARVVATMRNLEAFLDDAIKTDTSWHGAYQGDFLHQLRDKRVFEVGCGDGLNALVMAAMGAHVVANDISEQSTRILNEALPQCDLAGSVEPISGNFADLDLAPASFDIVVGKALLHHLTHDLEDQYLQKSARLLKPDGVARFFEPAVNSQFLDRLRWMVPVHRRPSILSRRAFARWKEEDPHPERDNSTDHYVEVGRSFKEIEIVPIGSVERILKLYPRGSYYRPARRWAHRVETRLPAWFRRWAARSQLIVYKFPAGCTEITGEPCTGKATPRIEDG